MNTSARHRFTACVLALALAPAILAQQQQNAATTPTSTPPTPGPVDTNAARFPPILEDGGISIQIMGWMLDARPILQAGASSSATTIDNMLGLPHESRPIPGVEISLPAGTSNSVRLSYFRLMGQGDTYAPADTTVSGTGFNAGDSLNEAYTMQMVKGYWDFLSYTVDPGRSNLRIKTLWGVQWVRFNSTIDSPSENAAALLIGNSPTFTAYTEKNLIYPILGIGLEQARTRFFRWEASFDGFGIPHHPGFLDGEVNAVLRAGKFDVLVGARYFYFKTSPESDEYFRGVLWGPSIALRWYYLRGGQ